jgi:hypothetical protein
MSDDIKQRLAAAGLRVKPLVWEVSRYPNGTTRHTAGEYRIWDSHKGYEVYFGGQYNADHTTTDFDEAKSLCQAEHERRVFQMMEEVPHAD